jgi:hypothetical protein
MTLNKEMPSFTNTYRLRYKAVYTKEVETKLILTCHAINADITVYEHIYPL